MKKNKLTIEISANELVITNFLLANFLELLKEKEQLRKICKISNDDIRQGESFRKELLERAFESESFRKELFSDYAKLLNIIQ